MFAERLRTVFSTNEHRVAVDIASLSIELRYGELAAAADEWSHALGSIGRPLVLLLDKGPRYYELMAMMFLHRVSFCPLDPLNPDTLVAAVCSALGNPVVLCDASDRIRSLRSLGLDVIDVREPREFEVSSGNCEPGRYFISTSGSTGVPKLVEVRHDALQRVVDWGIEFLGVTATSRFSQFASIGFDLSIAEISIAWSSGAALVPTRSLAEIARLDRMVTTNRITHWLSVPSVVPYLTRDPSLDFSALEVLIFCGEPLLRTHCEAVWSCAPGARIVNTYGPTEGTVFCTYYEVTDRDIANPALPSMPIGTAISGWNLLFLREPTTPTEPTDESEDFFRLVILGEDIAEGYFGRHHDDFSEVSVGSRMVRSFNTGDYFTAVGQSMCFSHRADQMVKINGNRVDLGQIANACSAAGVQHPLVLVIDHELVVCHDGGMASVGTDPISPVAAAEIERVTASLRTMLPPALLPKRHVVISSFPRTASGKIDRTRIAQLLDDYEAISI